MHRLILTTLMVSVLGCGSGEESQPNPSSSEANTSSPPAQVGASKADTLIAEGKRLFDKKKYAAAIEAFSEAIQLDDRNAVAYRERVRAHMFSAGHGEFLSTFLSSDNTRIIDAGIAVDRPERRSFQTALADLEIAIRLDSSNIESYKLQGRCLMELGDFDRAIAAFGEAIRLAPRDADAYHKRGTGYTPTNDWAKAIDDFTRAVELDPKMVKSFLSRAMSRSMAGDMAGSLADFDTAIRLDGTNSRAYDNRAVVYLKMREYEKAVASSTNAIELAPRKWSPYYNRGIAYLGLEQPSKTIADFSKTISLDSGNYGARVNLAATYMSTGLFSKALIEIDTAIKLAPNVAEMHRIRSEMLAKMDRPDEARAAQRKTKWLRQLAPLDQAVTRQPKDPQSYQRRAVHYADDEQWENAISDFNKALQLDSDSVDALVERAKAWLSQGKFQKAIDDCEQALKHSTHREIYSVRGDAYLGLGDCDRAIADYEKARRFDTQVAQAFLMRSKKRKAAGETSAAEKDLQHAIAIDPSLSGLR
jgi:tetratricopeptide (TPR) repeat protein